MRYAVISPVRLFFGSSAGGLLASQAAAVEFYSDGGATSLGAGSMLPTGEIVPVPEASATGTAAICAGLALGRRRRSRRPCS